MQDIQNIPNPDVNSTENEHDLNSHSDFPDTDVEQPSDLPLPPDQTHNAPVEEPPETEKPAIDEDNPQPEKFV